jgi:hypothetical protein
VLAALDTSEGIALGAGILAVLSFLVAVWSVTVARKANSLSEKANKVAEGSNALSTESNEIARQALGHTARGIDLAESVEVERQRQDRASAKIEANLSPLFLTVQASTANFRAAVRLTNVSERESGRTVVRVYMSPYQSGDLMAFDDEHTRQDRVRPIVDPEVKFHDPSGAELPAQYLQRTIDNISTTMPEEFRVILPVPIPAPGQGRYRLPVRITARAEHANEVCEWTDYVQTEYGAPPS